MELTVSLDPANPIFARVLGSKDFVSEKILAYELGYRMQPTDHLFIDAAAFYNRYSDLLSIEPRPSFVEPPGSLVFPLLIDNKINAKVYGFELVADWRWVEWWRLRASYAYLQMDLTRKPGSSDGLTVAATEGSSPHNQFSLLSFIDLPGNLQLDGVFRYVDNLPSQNVGRYFNLDLRLGWRATGNLELSLVGQNLLSSRHAEWGSGTQIQRGIYTKATWRW